MLYLKQDGTFGDTHESTNDHYDELERIGDDIIEEFESWYCDNCSFSTYSDYSGECCAPGRYIEDGDSPDYDKSLQETIDDYTKDMSQEDIDYITEYVKDNVASESDLLDRAREHYADSYDDGPDYDDYGD